MALSSGKAGGPMRVFVSSTFIDNKARRKLVEDAILTAGLVPVGMERFTAGTLPAVDECREQVRGCDVLVGILAYRYGWIPSGEERSITEIEYDTAAEHGVPRLMFIIDESIKIDPNADFDQGPDRWIKQDKLDKLKGKVQRDQQAARFTEETLGMRVLQAINELRVRQERSSEPARDHQAVSDLELVEALAAVFWDPDHAALAAADSGFPRQDLPAFKTARIFWARVVADARHGKNPGGVSALAGVAARRYPGNPIFARHGGKDRAKRRAPRASGSSDDSDDGQGSVDAHAADRARARAARMLTADGGDGIPSTPEERISLAVELSRTAWAFSAQPLPSYERAHMPVRVIRR